ncbi:hypothetical protein CMV24_02015 [Pseudomonas plecoglossicida]|uniref:Uncharacterized protein n=1 Tax=Pseudomonas plecoglossicida TaxID=70775 RepID=A0A2A3MBQ8_PSEDL|nr:hypothetical protein [Pseudomonas plecoglossicida]PBJ97518.1 hypothetical protein CMV24_02015 [Pseudomonas plecoglossicida]
MDKLVFQQSPIVELGSNKFINTPIILQFDETPLIQVVRQEQAGFTTEIPIFHQDGTYLAKAVGSRLHKTEDGNKAGVTLEHRDKVTVCKLNGRVLFEIQREEAAALKTAAELYTPNGYFVKYTSLQPGIIDSEGNELNVNGLIMTGNTFAGARIGIWMKSDGSVGIGCA